MLLKKGIGILSSSHTNSIELYKGNDAWWLLSLESFLHGWDQLYQTCPWATVFQSRSFISTWYQTYRQKFDPILVANYRNNRLVGLLTLTIPTTSDGKRIIRGAGRFEAVYQPWLTEECDGGDFIKMALSNVLNQFPAHSIRLKYIPQNVPLNWINEPYWKGRSVLQVSMRPLIEVEDTLSEKMYRKTNFRSKLNKLKRLGAVEFERITQFSQFLAVFNELITLYDFRQGARFNLSQFRDEPLKADFYLSLFKQGLLHVTVLKANGKIFAAVVAVGTQKCVHLSGMIVHAPFYARYCSPGFLHLVLLSQQLISDGVTIFDLTPGGDAYKERMSTKHDQVFELFITNSVAYRFKCKIRKWMYATLIKLGKWPMGIELALRKGLYLLRARIYAIRKQSVIPALKRIGKKCIHPSKELVYVFENIKDLSNNTSCTFKRNALQDLLCYEGKDTFMSRWEFLQNAMKRLEMGETAFTFCSNGLLLGCVWLSHCAATAPMGTGVCNKVERGRVFQGFYCHPMFVF